MPSRSHLAAALLGLFLAGPAIADDLPPGLSPVTYIEVGALAVDADFTVFMRNDVPEEVRRLALRRLWVVMQLPVSCHELCAEVEIAPSVLANVAMEKQPVATH
jgi:uncharacterized protein DUF3306